MEFFLLLNQLAFAFSPFKDLAIVLEFFLLQSRKVILNLIALVVLVVIVAAIIISITLIIALIVAIAATILLLLTSVIK